MRSTWHKRGNHGGIVLLGYIYIAGATGELFSSNEDLKVAKVAKTK